MVSRLSGFRGQSEVISIFQFTESILPPNRDEGDLRVYYRRCADFSWEMQCYSTSDICQIHHHADTNHSCIIKDQVWAREKCYQYSNSLATWLFLYTVQKQNSNLMYRLYLAENFSSLHLRYRIKIQIQDRNEINTEHSINKVQD